METAGRMLITTAVVLLLVGLVILGISKLTGGRGLPGDLIIDRERVKVVIPLATSLLISLVLTLLFNLFLWWSRRGK